MFNQDFLLPDEVRQILFVKPALEGPTGTLLAMSRMPLGDGWVPDLPIIPVVLGANGYTFNKVEGDKKTPLGCFCLGSAFGVADKAASIKFDYIKLGVDDKFIDDPEHPDYNRWICGETTAKSYETMLRNDERYDLGIIVEYNMHPIIVGLGSAIFIHIWENSKTGTAGCIAMSSENLQQLLAYLKPQANPHIAIF